ncbi:hypothetical protein DM860_014610 [Cuscuta australis]|uniref:Pectin acetylesterase n=1 Tax=Cuscuta australis TaxID=267555 RepID=A0A328DJ01_9ASTE|nr:hypothetical protein DM860_014610 [Cuscuta australis]
MKLALLLSLLLILLSQLALIHCFQHQQAVKADGGSTRQPPVYPTFLSNNRAVCLSGNRASYNFVKGYGEGLTKWLVFLPGGGWCENFTSCLNYTSGGLSRSPDPDYSGGMLSSRKLENPDFYNWNRVKIRYCDGSSFTGNSRKFHNGTWLHFRGAIIFKAAMKELLQQKGMASATQAVLAGESAGGVATMLHCDKFRRLFPNSTRVKCLSDAGYFFPAKRHNFGSQSRFLSIFQGLIRLHRSIKALPRSCTQKLNPALCFFAHNVMEYIKTPVFFIVSQYDFIEISWTTGLSKHYYATCVLAKNCSSQQLKIMQDAGLVGNHARMRSGSMEL